MQVTSPDYQILNQFARNQNMHMWIKYKTDFKKYWKYEVDKYKSISVEIKRSERADFVDLCPDFGFFQRGWTCSCTPLTPSSGTLSSSYQSSWSSSQWAGSNLLDRIVRGLYFWIISFWLSSAYKYKPWRESQSQSGNLRLWWVTYMTATWYYPEEDE